MEMKKGDLVRWKQWDRRIGLFLEWKTFDEKTNPYTCPVILWAGNNNIGAIQSSLIEIINEKG